MAQLDGRAIGKARRARPALLVHINDLPLADVEILASGGVRIGALARMSDIAQTPAIVQRYPAVSQVLLLGASEQPRNMASMGGNLCQRVRCAYFRDNVSPCNKARAWYRMLGAGRAEPRPRHLGHQRSPHRDAPVRRRGRALRVKIGRR